MEEMPSEPSVWRCPGWILAKICPLTSRASQSWLDDLLKSSQPREMIVDLLLATDRQPLRELLPPLARLQGEVPLFELPVRARNCLQHNGVDAWEQVLDLEPAHIQGFRNAGDVTVRSVVEWCVAHAERVVREHPGDHPVGGSSDEDLASQEAEAPDGSWGVEPSRESWRHLNQQLAALFSASMNYRGAETVADALDRDLEGILRFTGLSGILSQIRLDELVDPEPVGSLIRSATRRLIGESREVEAAVLARLVYVANPTGCRKLGQQLGVTSECIRQTEKRVKNNLEKSLGDLMSEVVGLWVPLVPAVVTEDDLAGMVHEFLGCSSEVDAADDLAVRYLVFRMGRSSAGRLMLSPEAASSFKRLKNRAKELSDSVGLLPEENLRDEFDALAESGYWNELLEAAGLHRIGESLGFQKTAKAQVKAALLEIGRPATKEEIAEFCGPDVNRVSSHLSGIEGVARSDKYRWGLVGWIDDIYEGIPAEIIQRIEEDGGVTTTERVLEELPRLFGVAEGSVWSYLATPHFTVRDGYVSVTDPSTLTYRDLDDVIDGRNEAGNPYWTFPVEERYLRGYSITGVPPEVARALGCGPNESVRVELVDPAGCESLSVIWRLWSPNGTASVGYLADPLKALGTSAGMVVRLELLSDGRACLAIHEDAPESGSADADDLLQRIKKRRRFI